MRYSQFTTSLEVTLTELTGLVSSHKYPPPSVIITRLILTMLLFPEKMILSLGVRGSPSFIHSMFRMEPDASQVKVTELFSMIGESGEILIAGSDIFSVDKERELPYM